MRKQKAIGWSVVGLVVVALGIFLVSRAGNKIQYTPPSSGVVRPPVRGSDKAQVTVEEFSDFQCPACKLAEPVVKDVIETFGDRIKLTFYNFPLVTIHTQAFRAALAAECANDQGKFWEYNEKLFEEQPNFSRDELVQYASGLGLAIDGPSGFGACVDSRYYTETIRADMREGDSRGVQGTPTFYVDGSAVADWSQLKQVIQGKLLGG